MAHHHTWKQNTLWCTPLVWIPPARQTVPAFVSRRNLFLWPKPSKSFLVFYHHVVKVFNCLWFVNPAFEKKDLAQYAQQKGLTVNSCAFGLPHLGTWDTTCPYRGQMFAHVAQINYDSFCSLCTLLKCRAVLLAKSSKTFHRLHSLTTHGILRPTDTDMGSRFSMPIRHLQSLSHGRNTTLAVWVLPGKRVLRTRPGWGCLIGDETEAPRLLFTTLLCRSLLLISI